MNNFITKRVLARNESEANRIVARVMLVTILTFTVVFILNVIGVFVINQTAMTFAFISTTVIMLIPQVFNRVFKPDTWWLKYLYTIISVVFILIVVSTLTYHVVLIYAYPIAIAGVYFSKRVTYMSIVLTLIATVVGQILGFWLECRPDDNFETWHELFIYSIIPKFLLLLSFSFLLAYITERTSDLLNDDMESYEQLSAYNQNMIYSFATLVESRDSSTGGHIKRTSKYAQLLAEELQRDSVYKEMIDDDFVNCITTVAPLHDIGKIAIPDSILKKKSDLTESEFKIMKSHAQRGGEIIKKSFSKIADEQFKKMAYEVAVFHHEKWNGKGYPMGRKNVEIPLSARIMSIADVFDALSEERCYRDAMPLDECFDRIKEARGSDFDPVLVDAFLNIKDKIAEAHNSITHSENE